MIGRACRKIVVSAARVCEAVTARVVLTALYLGVLSAQMLLRPVGVLHQRCRRKTEAPTRSGHTVLVIATFYTRNWCRSHLAPLAETSNVNRVIAVVDGPIQRMDRVEYASIPPWLSRLCGRSGAKLVVAIGKAWKSSPDLVMGYHILPNALWALLVSRMVGGRAAYQATGGPVQLVGGGAGSENCLLRRLQSPSAFLERLALRLGRCFDLVVVRGVQARNFMEDNGIGRRVRVIPGGIDTQRFEASRAERDLDLVTVGRLVTVKQVDQFLHIVAELKKQRGAVRAAMVGDGPLRDDLERLAAELCVTDCVQFLGHVERVEDILGRSRIFVLTSQSEGLSIAMAEAMAAGVVPVVARVGDLGELVECGRNGRLIAPDHLKEYADRIAELLNSPSHWDELSRAARDKVVEYSDVRSVAEKWTEAIRSTCAWPGFADAPARIVLPRRRSIRTPSAWKMWESLPPSLRTALTPLCRFVPQAMTLGRRFRRWDDFVKEADGWRVEKSRAYGLSQVQRICRHAYNVSPFYRRWFDDAGVRPQHLENLGDFRRLPTIDRKTVQDHLEEMSTAKPDWPGVETTSTGGTSGRPLRFYIGTDRSAVEYAYLVNAWRRAGYHLNLPQAVLRGRIVSPNGRGLRREHDPLLRRYYYSTFHLTEENIAGYLEDLATLGPCYLHVYPSSVDALAGHLLRKGAVPPSNVLGILAGSEIVYPHNRERAEKAFGVRCFSWYGHTEKLVFAAECEHSSDYHVFPTYGYFELLDAMGQPVTEPGKRGEIVGTGFLNTVTPFIRYRTGDHATYVADRCHACGREQVLIRDIRGHRTQELLVGRDGQLIPWTALNMHDATFDGVRRFQFLQTEPGRATLRVVPGPSFQDTDRRRILDGLRPKLGGVLDLDLCMCEDIGLTISGKTTYVDQRLDVAGLRLEECLS